MSGIGRQILVNTNLINVCLLLLPLCVRNHEEDIIKCLKDIKDDDADNARMMMTMMIVMMSRR